MENTFQYRQSPEQREIVDEQHAETRSDRAVVDAARGASSQASLILSAAARPRDGSSGSGIEDFGSADLDEQLDRNIERSMDTRRFRAELRTAEKTGAEGLRAFAYGGEGLRRFTPKQLLEISSRFRLGNHPEDEVRVYEECSNEAFRAIPRVQEFYALACIKRRETGKSIAVLRGILDAEQQRAGEDGRFGNKLVWGILGDAYTDLAISAEKFAQAAADAGSLGGAPRDSLERFERNFGYDPRTTPSGDFVLAFRELYGVEPPTTIEGMRLLSAACLRRAERTYELGFLSAKDGFNGLGYLRRIADRYAALKSRQAAGELAEGEEREIARTERALLDQKKLCEVVVEKEGGEGSLDYWTHASRIELAVHEGDSDKVAASIARGAYIADAAWKLKNTEDRIRRLADGFRKQFDARSSRGEDTSRLSRRIAAAEAALAGLAYSRRNMEAGQRDKLQEKGSPENADETFRRQTFEFRGLVESPIPQYIPGGLTRAGARTPDLLVNREDVQIMNEIIRRLGLVQSPGDWIRLDHEAIGRRMRGALARIQEFVRRQLDASSLQYLKGKPHAENDALSDGLIHLNGLNLSRAVNVDQRKETRSITNLTMVLLAGLGDCRETMVLVGCLFAAYQAIVLGDLIARAHVASGNGERDLFTRITQETIPEIQRYEVRGGHMGVYAGIAVNNLYDSVEAREGDPTAVERRFLFRSGQSRADAKMSDYEFGNAVVVATLADGQVVRMEPQIVNKQPVIPPDGVPVIEGAAPDWSNVLSVELLNKVEQHSMTFLHVAPRDGEPGRIERADGFYNERFNERGTSPQYRSPYSFGSGAVSMEEAASQNMVRAGSRDVAGEPGPDGRPPSVPVYLRFLPYSKTDYVRSLGEGDVPGRMRLHDNELLVPERAVDLLFARMGKDGRRAPTINDDALVRVRQWFGARRMEQSAV